VLEAKIKDEKHNQIMLEKQKEQKLKEML